MMIPIIYINPNGLGIGGKAVVPPLVVFHLRVGDSMFAETATFHSEFGRAARSSHWYTYETAHPSVTVHLTSPVDSAAIFQHPSRAPSVLRAPPHTGDPRCISPLIPARRPNAPLRVPLRHGVPPRTRIQRQRPHRPPGRAPCPGGQLVAPPRPAITSRVPTIIAALIPCACRPAHTHRHVRFIVGVHTDRLPRLPARICKNIYFSSTIKDRLLKKMIFFKEV